jgi:hypothetical protein
MEKKFALVLFCLFSILALGVMVLAQQSTEPEKPKIKKEQCLGCHGSYDKLAEKTANYKTPSEETTSPHKYVPHSEKTDIPECTECHTPHVIPLKDKATVVKPKEINLCYDTPGCHHMHTLQACKACHGG